MLGFHKSVNNIEQLTITLKDYYFWKLLLSKLHYTNEWFKVNEDIRSTKSAKKLKKAILDFIRPKENSVHAIHDISCLKLLTRFKVNLVT